MCKKILLLAICCCLCTPVLAAETIESLSVRVTEMEKANYVMQEDLARTRLELDIAISMLQDSTGNLDKKVAKQSDTLVALAQQTQHDLDTKVNAQNAQLQTSLTDVSAMTQKNQQDILARLAALDVLLKQQNSDLHAAAADQKNHDDVLAHLSALEGMIKQQNTDLLAKIMEKQRQYQDIIAAIIKLFNEEIARQDQQSPGTGAAGLRNDLNTLLAELANINAEGDNGLPVKHSHESVSGPLSTVSLQKAELYRLRIVNSADGEISVSRDGGGTWQQVGRVVTPALKIEKRGESCPVRGHCRETISSTAVNGIAIRTAYNEAQQTSTAFYLLPTLPKSDRWARPPPAPSARGSHPNGYRGRLLDVRRSMDAVQGEPGVPGDPDGLQPLPSGYTPAKHDVLVICAQQPKNLPQSYVFENSFGGFVTEHGLGRQRKYHRQGADAG